MSDEDEKRNKRLSEAEKEAVYEGIVRSEHHEYEVLPKKQRKRWWDKLIRRKKRMMEP